MDEIAIAFSKAPRRHFLPDEVVPQASLDMPLPIGFSQTSSQPSTVRFMLERLEVEPGQRILDVGSGSGWTTALLANLSGPDGRVFAVELIPELVSFGRDNCRKLGIKNAHFYQAGRKFGLPALGPYDRILVSAATDELPDELCDQLKTGGKMVVPVGHSVLEVEKMQSDELDVQEHHGFAFVPLVKPGV